jgi:uncharacterized lipoprotein YmbA
MKKHKQLQNQLGDQLGDQLRDQLGNQLRYQLYIRLWGKAARELTCQLSFELRKEPLEEFDSSEVLLYTGKV